MDEVKYRYIAEWFDSSIKVNRKFILTFFPSDNSVEMFDTQSKKLFLKRIKCESLDPADVYVGGAVNVLSRQLFLIDYGDEITRAKYTRDSELSIAFVKDSGFQNLGTILDKLQQNGFSITKGYMVRNQGKISNSGYLSNLGRIFAVFELRGEYASEVWKKMLGQNSNLGRSVTQLGVLSNDCFAPNTPEAAKAELDVFFPATKTIHCNTAVMNNSTCCIIKPHAVREGKVGKIVQEIIDRGFRITALEYINFDLPCATEFLEVYKGVLPFYQDMASQMTSGPCVALEVMRDGSGNVVEEFRELVGPMDADIAQRLRPSSLRAKYGTGQVKNAVHCTDLPEDGKIEVEYVFRILACP